MSPVTSEWTLLEDTLYRKIPYNLLKKHLSLPVLIAGQLHLLMADGNNPFALEELSLFFKEPLHIAVGPQEKILHALEAIYAQEAGSKLGQMENGSEQTISFSHDEDLLDDREQAPSIQLLNAIITEALTAKASDIHFEPCDEGLIVRFRIDGLLTERLRPPSDLAAKLIVRLKVLARLDIAQSRLPQDGRIKLFLGKRPIDFRVSTLPVMGGERIVLRILDQGSVALDVHNIGMPLHVLAPFCELIKRPEGMILVTGPTGSGKTTTLYSAIRSLNAVEKNIMTIEDPVEFKLTGIAQMAVDARIDLTFAAGLRHILRQDPDVVLVGEIRDEETASIAVQAAMTGHLVLSTLHTNDAPSAIPRLIDMGIEPYLINSSLLAVIAQRLIRLYCPTCRGSRCTHCGHTGYKGRTAIFELMPMTAGLRLSRLTSSDKLHTLAQKEGMLSLRESGMTLVNQGLTSIDELNLVLGTL